MTHRAFCWRPALFVVSLLVITLAPVQSHLVAQGNGNRPNAPTSARNSKSFGTVSESDRLRKWASDTMAKHDKSGNKILDGDELRTLGQSARSADINDDEKITLDELFQNSMSKTKGTTSNASTLPSKAAPKDDTKPSAKSLAKRKIVKSTRKSYRFKSTKERLSSWRFASKDANGDGQVSMSEYARAWTDRVAAEFQRYDQDNDGMVTAAEAK